MIFGGTLTFRQSKRSTCTGGRVKRHSEDVQSAARKQCGRKAWQCILIRCMTLLLIAGRHSVESWQKVAEAPLADHGMMLPLQRKSSLKVSLCTADEAVQRIARIRSACSHQLICQTSGARYEKVHRMNTNGNKNKGTRTDNRLHAHTPLASSSVSRQVPDVVNFPIGTSPPRGSPAASNVS